jgi:hypothetical protein
MRVTLRTKTFSKDPLLSKIREGRIQKSNLVLNQK